MSKLFKRKGFRLASVAYFLSLGTLAVALFAWFSTSSTLSWFASNKTVDGTGMAIKVKTDENVNIEMHVYKYVETGTGTGVYTVQKDPDSIAMSRYDQVFQEDNGYAPILLQLKLTGGFYEDNSPLPLVIHHDSNFDKTVITDTDTTSTIADDDSTYHLSSYISSVVSVKAMVYNTTISGEGSYSSEAENVFKTMKSQFEKTTSPAYKTRFFLSSIPTAGPATKTDINFSDGGSKTGVEGNLLYSATEVDGVSTCMVYVWIDYDTSTTIYQDTSNGYNGLINAYIAQMQGTSLGINVSYPIKSDITELSIVKSDLPSADSNA